MGCWRYTPTPKQDRFQDLLEAICPELSAHNFNQIKYLSLLFQHTSTVECRSCVVYAQDNNSLPVWIILVTSLLTHIPINSQPFLVGIVSDDDG